MFENLDTSASALTAQRTRMNAIAANVAGMNVTHDADGKPNPYRRKFAIMAEGHPNDPDAPGVHIVSVEQDQSPFRKVLDWSHPDHDKDGYVKMPNIDLAIEMVDMMEASRAYEANISAMEVSKSMMNATLRLLA